MDIDDQPTKAESLKSFTTGPLSSSLSRLGGSSRGLPAEKDFHFYNNFGEFKNPLRKVADSSKLILGSIGDSWEREIGFDPEDFDEAYDWLVGVNDEVFERFDSSIDEFKKVREKEEETGVKSSVEGCEEGFQLVCGKKKKKGVGLVEKDLLGLDSNSNSGVKVASRDKKTMGAKPKIPFHIPTIPRPQDEFKIVVNNANMPFEHVWLQRSEDGSRFIHPQENFSASDFVDRFVGDGEPVKPPPIESTPFKLVEEVTDLKALAATLRGVNEFAVDLEHNQYRSFQGLTCLMQISTRTEDFIVDTLKLRIHVGPYLREVFKDPTKKKIMHGADRDIVWLQRDFGIYICNMFDTGQASRVLKLERNSLEYLLSYFCEVTANKEYQNADWRLRPLPAEMIKYAREDTHYLLYIHDLLKVRLLSASAESEQSDDPLTEVYKRSYDICMQLYEKELLTDSSYLYIYGLQGADLNAQQLAVVAGLCEWRDIVARAEDESTGYVLPNKTVLEIAKQMPVTASKLRNLVKSKHPYVERNYGSVVSIIKHSMQNAAAFEAVAEQLKEIRIEKASEESTMPADANETLVAEASATVGSVEASSSMGSGTGPSMTDGLSAHPPDYVHSEKPMEIGHASGCNNLTNNEISDPHGEGSIKTGQNREINTSSSVLDSSAVATVQVLKKPNRAFGAMFGKSSSKRKLDADKKEESKLEQIKSSVNLPFHTFTGSSSPFSQNVEEPAKVVSETPTSQFEEPSSAGAKLEDVILLEKDEDMDEPVAENNKGEGNKEPSPETKEGEETRTLSDLSSSFQQCFKTLNQSRKCKQPEKPNELDDGFPQLKPFDYETARQQVRFGENQRVAAGEEEEGGGEGGRKKSNKMNKKKNSSAGGKSEESGDFQLGRRRQAFPATGNRSATFRG